MPARAPKDTDVRDTTELLRIVLWFGGPAFVIITLGEVALIRQQGWPPEVLLLFLVLNVPLIGALVLGLRRGIGSSAKSVVGTILAAGDIAPPRSYPHADALIARGRYAEAADLFHDHVRIEPDDLTARLRLAELLEDHLRDFTGAEALYLEVRRLRPDARQEMTVANGLIDLYRRAGRLDRLKVELARFADRYRGTTAGDAARRELGELKTGERGRGKGEG
jgi:tetratricopeptide (TPR) repeat protein